MYLGCWRAHDVIDAYRTQYDGMALRSVYTPFTALRCTEQYLCVVVLLPQQSVLASL